MVDTSFMDDVRFPTLISWGSVGGPDWLVEVVALASGFEERNSPWSAPLRRYDAKYGVRDFDELYEVQTLYLAAMGRLRGFRLKDWTDYRSASPTATPTDLDQVIGTGDGATAAFQLVKTYAVAAHSFARKIAKPVAGTVVVAVDAVAKTEGVDFTVDTATGVVTFTSPPPASAQITAGYEFDVPARFDAALDLTIRGPIGDIPSIPLVELKV